MKTSKKLALMSATTLAVLIGAVTFLPLRAIAGLETPCNYISDLVSTNPLSSDLASTGDDHLRCIKLALKTTFPNLNGAVSATDENLSLLTGLSGTVWTSANDGAASGLDADLLDTFSSAAFARLAVNNSFTERQDFTKARTAASEYGALLQSAVPILGFIESDAAANNARWFIGVNAEQFLGRILNDAEGTDTTWLSVDRTSTTVDTINLQATAVQTNGVSITAASGTFSASFDDACTTSPSVTVDYQAVGNLVTMSFRTQATCTGDAVNYQTTGTPVPAAIRPSGTNAVSALYAGFLDNGSNTLACVTVTTAGNIIFGRNATGCQTNGWTNSGSRDSPAGINVSYLLGDP